MGQAEDNDKLNTTANEATTDSERLRQAMQGIETNKYVPIDPSTFDDPTLAQTFNNMLDLIARRNNEFLIRLNDAMGRIGNNNNIKNLMDNLEAQQGNINVLQEAKQSLSFSMKKIEDSSLEMLALSRQIRNSYEPCTFDLSESYENVDSALASIKSVVEDIKNGSFDSVDKDDMMAYTEEFVSTMELFISAIETQKVALKDSIDSLMSLKGRIETVIDDVLLITNTMDKQNLNTAHFVSGIDQLSSTYEALSLHGFDIGEQLYRISRDVDNARNDMFRNNSRPTIHDTLRVYEIDHLTLSWRIYNHIMELETLKITQVNNTDRCKFGLWSQNPYPEVLVDSPGLRHTIRAHENLHKHAIASFMAKEDYDIPLAKKEFQMTLESFKDFQLGMDEMHTYLTANGYVDETPLWKFK
ncbi:MAG: hypothetical protein II799_00900 [Lachnospiraceae bacterium]|nr:hypothetical protein [Lachnospiraceae bacterium]